MAENSIIKWSIDPGHSQVQFRVKHLALATISGTFKIFAGEVLSESENFENAKVHCVINAGSIDTNNGQRDKDLKSETFLNTEIFPEIVFDGMLNGKNDNYQLEGDLTLHGITNHVVMEAEFTGTGVGRFSPQTRAGFEVTGRLNRKDYGLTWNMLTEAGGIIIGDEIRLHFDIQLIGQ